VRLFALVAAVAVPLLGVLGWVSWAEFERVHRDARELALRIARSYAADIEAANVRSAHLLDRMSERPKIRNAHAGDCDSLFAIVDFFPQYITLLLYDPSGALICASTPQESDQRLAAIAERDVTAYLGAGSPQLDVPILRKFGDEWVSIAFRNVQSNGQHTGVLALVQSFDLDVSSYPEATVLTVADSRGRVIARSVRAEKWLGRNVHESELAKLTLTPGEGRVQARGVDGQLRQYGYTRVAGTGWHVFVGVPAGVAMAAVWSLALRGITAGAIVLVIVVLLAYRLAATIERPLEVLATAAQRTGVEGYGVKVPTGGPHEVAMVAEAFNRMVDSRADAENALVESRHQLQALSKRLLDVQEEERARIAREVHDQLGQALTALKMDVGGLLRETPPQTPQQEAMTNRIRTTLDDTLDAVQRISSELRPGTLDDFGLTAAINSDVRAFEERTGIECEVSFPEADPPLEVDTQTAVYRIVQEAMTNVARHSDATRVEIRARVRGDEMVIEVRDDGRGIRPEEIDARDALGLAGMRERARLVGGSLDVEGVDGRGTIVSLRVPLRGGESTT
jgi:signal transduction histidine kinase